MLNGRCSEDADANNDAAKTSAAAPAITGTSPGNIQQTLTPDQPANQQTKNTCNLPPTTNHQTTSQPASHSTN